MWLWQNYGLLKRVQLLFIRSSILYETMLTDVNEILELNIKNRSVCMAYCKLQVGTRNSCVKLAIAMHVVLLSVAIYHFFCI